MTSQSTTIAGVSTVCIRSPNWVGDVVMATPAFRCIRSGLPGARIVLLVRESVADVLRGAPWFDHVITYRGTAPGSFPGIEFLRCVARLRRQRCELGFLLPSSFSSALMFFLGGVRRRVGYVRDGRGLLLTTPLPRPSLDGRFQPTYMVDFYLALCRAASLGADDRRTELPYSEQDVHQATQFLRDAGVDPSSPLVLLHPAAGYGPAKRWTEAGWAELARMLDGELRAQVACIGAPSGQELTGRIVALSAAPVLDLTSCGIDLHLLKCIVRMSRLLVTTDSGPRHYGVALGVPTVCLMGPTHPGYSTSGRPNDHVVRVEVECGPCQRKACTTDHRCMALLTPELVMDACRTAIERGSEADGD